MKRRSGVLLHPLSLPGPYQSGTLGASIDVFLDFCRQHHQSVWQVLPLGPTGYGDSPYQSFSTHAGNPYLIDIDELRKEGLATPEEEAQARTSASPCRVDYCSLYEDRRPLLYRIAREFPNRAGQDERERYGEFCRDQNHWLEDYAQYMTIKEIQGKSWMDWPKPLRLRQKKAMQAFCSEHQAEIEVQKVVQWFFAKQWEAVRTKARKAGVEILGDLPIFVALDSADSWAHPQLFQFDAQRRPEAVAGVPPDYFSADGQLWGNPLYRWEKHQSSRFAWWKERVRSALRLFDSVRIDHFRGFAAYWRIPAAEKTARNGEWVTAPGEKLLKSLQQEFPNLPIVAEDLGDITPDVNALRDRFELPGMKVLQFAFSDPGNAFLPHNHDRNFIVYPGTHDNDTVKGWYLDSERRADQKFFRHYLGLPEDTPVDRAVQQMVRLAMRSVANLAVIALQDVYSLDSSARMNTPSSGENNWQWRATAEQLEQEYGWFKEATWMAGRA